MIKNPYKFIGPLDPVEDAHVCMPRGKEKTKVIHGILNGEYWTILGPRQIGKTTFLRQLMHELSANHCIYINFEISPKTDTEFYEWITQRIVESIPSDASFDLNGIKKSFGPELTFYSFLEKFKPKNDKRIIFFFDEMEKAHCVRSFLHLWRKVFHERYHRVSLRKYGVVIAGKVDLSSLTTGETSPFNIAQKIELSDLSVQETENLITTFFLKHKIDFPPIVKDKIILQLSGHPQLLQHTCSILAEKAIEGSKLITQLDAENALDRLAIENNNLKTLEIEIKTNKVLESLVSQILKGKEKDFLAYRELSITGTGPIISNGPFCAIRNKIYEKMINNIVSSQVKGNESINNRNFTNMTEASDEFITTIFVNAAAPPIPSSKEEINFLGSLFDVDGIRFRIQKNYNLLPELDFNRTEKLIFYYLSYENYKASRMETSPSLRQFHLSSVPRNNLKQEPEWNLFVEAVNKETFLSKNSNEPDGTIRASIFSIRKKLKAIGAEDLLPRQKPGGGEGYWLKCIIEFSSPFPVTEYSIGST